MEIRPQWTNFPAGSTHAVKPERLTPGDVIQARILHTTSEGKTHLQIGPHEVISDYRFRGKAGDNLLFEVLPPTSEGKHRGQPKPRLLIRLIEDQRSIARIPRGRSSDPSAQATSRRAGRPAVLLDLPPMTGDTALKAPTPAVLALNAARLFGPLTALGRKWRRQMKRQITGLVSRSRSAAQIASRHPSAEKRSGPAPESADARKAEIRKIESPWNHAAEFRIDSVGDGQRSARINLGTRQASKSTGTWGRILTASLMLSFEATGDVEVDVQMHEDQIQVTFTVTTEAVRGLVQSRLREMHAALKALVPKVYCQVLLARAGDATHAYTDTAGADKKEIDCII